jgi:glutamate-5-semialdehyde dehydrogenase
MNIDNIAKGAKEASRILANLPASKKDEVLKDMAYALLDATDDILKANSKDVRVSRGKGKAFIDRLSLNEARIKQMADGLLDVAGLKDPVGQVISRDRKSVV